MKTIEYFENLNNVMEDRKYIRQNVGQYVAYKNYKESVRLGAEEYECSDPPYNEEDTKMFLETLTKVGIDGFYYTAKTTNTIEFLYICKKCGWYVIAVENLYRNNDIFGEEEKQGIWIKYCGKI